MANIFCRKNFFNEIIKNQNVADELLKKIKKNIKIRMRNISVSFNV